MKGGCGKDSWKAREVAGKSLAVVSTALSWLPPALHQHPGHEPQLLPVSSWAHPPSS